VRERQRLCEQLSRPAIEACRQSAGQRVAGVAHEKWVLEFVGIEGGGVRLAAHGSRAGTHTHKATDSGHARPSPAHTHTHTQREREREIERHDIACPALVNTRTAWSARNRIERQRERKGGRGGRERERERDGCCCCIPEDAAAGEADDLPRRQPKQRPACNIDPFVEALNGAAQVILFNLANSFRPRSRWLNCACLPYGTRGVLAGAVEAWIVRVAAPCWNSRAVLCLACPFAHPVVSLCLLDLFFEPFIRCLDDDRCHQLGYAHEKAEEVRHVHHARAVLAREHAAPAAVRCARGGGLVRGRSYAVQPGQRRGAHRQERRVCLAVAPQRVSLPT
jgi:hypothetical protein